MITERAKYPGAKAGIVSATTCLKCKIQDRPCEVPKPPPTALFGYWWSFWAWGRATKRFIRLVTFGKLQPKTECGCPQREAKLDRWGAKMAMCWRRLKQFLLP